MVAIEWIGKKNDVVVDKMTFGKKNRTIERTAQGLDVYQNSECN